MRICIIAPMFPPIRSGSSHYALNLANGLSSRGHYVQVIASNNALKNYDHFKVMRIPSLMIPSTPITHNYPLPFNFIPISYPLVSNIISKMNPDIIHINGQFLDLNLAAAIAAYRMEIPTVLTIHTRLVHTNGYLNSFFRAVDKSIISKIMSSINAVIALDRQMYMYIKDTYKLGARRIYTIPLAIDFDTMFNQPDDPSILADLGDSRIIVSLSHITALKTPKTLLHAFSRVCKQISDLKLVFVGSVNDTRVRTWVQDLGLEEYIIFMGEQNHEKIPTILRHAILETHALDYRSGFDNASIEAMAFGLPVISCVREDNFMRPWLKNWENVVLVQPQNVDMVTDALTELLQNESLRNTLKTNAQQSAKGYFSIGRMIDDLETLYEKIS